MGLSDVVVIGSGVAGLSAAITAHDLGAEVTIIEKMGESHAGGNSRVSGSVWFSPPSSKAAARHLIALCDDFVIDPNTIAAWAHEVTRNTEWVQSLGIPVKTVPADPEFPELDGQCDNTDYHVEPTWGHSRLWLALSEAARSRGIEIRYQARAHKLVQDPNSREVIGVKVQLSDGSEDAMMTRRGIVLATGGFANNPGMVRAFLRLPKARPWGSPASTGDGLAMAQQLGAGIDHITNFMGVPGLAVPNLDCGFRVSFRYSAGWILVGADGRRFINEDLHPRHGKVALGGHLQQFPDRIFHAVFDESTRLAGPIVNTPEDEPFGWNTIIEGYRWSSDNSIEVDRGWIAKGQTVRELADMIGLPSHQLDQTIIRYNRFCDEGLDPDEGRSQSTLVRIHEPPFYAYTWGPLISFTCGGPRKNARAQVLDSFGDPIARLYCAGEVSSTYSWGLAGGHMLADAMGFGRIAGRHAAAERPLFALPKTSE